MAPVQRILTQASTPFSTVAKRSFAASAVRSNVRDATTRRFGRNFYRLATALGTFLGFGLIYTYSPPFRTTTKEGRAFDKYLEKDWEKTEVREGDLGHKETDKQRAQEGEYRTSHQGQPKGDVP